MNWHAAAYHGVQEGALPGELHASLQTVYYKRGRVKPASEQAINSTARQWQCLSFRGFHQHAKAWCLLYKPSWLSWLTAGQERPHTRRPSLIIMNVTGHKLHTYNDAQPVRLPASFMVEPVKTGNALGLPPTSFVCFNISKVLERYES